MKIIDNIQDFYEYEAYMYGCEPDPSIIWKRNRETNKQLKDLIKDKNLYKNIEKILDKLFFNQYIFECWSYRNRYRVLHNETGIHIEQSIIGIYPNVYFCIRLVYTVRDVSSFYHKVVINMPLPIELLKDPAKIYDLIIDKIDKSDIPYIPTFITKPWDKKEIARLSVDSNVRSLNDPYITSCPQLFDMLGMPTFRIEYEGHGSYKIDTEVIVNNTELFKQYIREEIDPNVYSNIEQFIVHRNMQEIPEADNKTKIVNAGFDLKTSFRKM